MELLGLGYLGLATAKLEDWVRFGTEVIGMCMVDGRSEHEVRFRIDDHAYRVALRSADNEAVDYIGWEVRDEVALNTVAAELEHAEVQFERVSDQRARAERDVAEYLALHDPAGHRVEIFYGARAAATPFISERGCEFVTGPLGIGHVFLVVDDLESTRRFYELLGFRLSDVYDRGAALFYRCNAREHSLGLADANLTPFESGLNHFMVEVDELDAVGRAYDRCLDGAASLSTTLGRHSNDWMISFYVHTPSGFEMEYGWGGRRVEEDNWTVTELSVESFWGHRPLSDSPEGQSVPATIPEVKVADAG